MERLDVTVEQFDVSAPDRVAARGVSLQLRRRMRWRTTRHEGDANRDRDTDEQYNVIGAPEARTLEQAMRDALLVRLAASGT